MTTLNNISMSDLANVTGGRTLGQGRGDVLYSDGSFAENVPVNLSKRTRKDGGNYFVRVGNYSCGPAGGICGGQATDRE